MTDALELFRRMAVEVPAYRDFLTEQGVDPAAVTALGLLPLALGINHAGEEIEGPMAIAVLGGLVSSTLLNLVFLPALAQRFSRKTEVETL